MSGLITDTMPLQIIKCDRVMAEGKDGSRPVTRVTGLFQKAGVVNANGRMYPKDIMAKAIGDLQESIKARAVLSEFDHPTDAKIHMDRACQLITKVWMDGNDVFGECEILEDMPCGKMLKTLVDNKVRVSVSSRGVGDMETIKEGDKEYQQVCPGYSICTWDVVQEPSVPHTQLSVMESKNRIFNLKKQFEGELLEEIKDLLGGRKE
jgi:hypothetical protein